MHAKSLQSCPTLCSPMDCSLPGSSVHGILQTRILEWAAMPSSRGSSQPKDRTPVSYISSTGRRILYHCRHLGSSRRLLKLYFKSLICIFEKKIQEDPIPSPPAILVIPKLSKIQCCCFHASLCTLGHKDDPLFSHLSSISQFFYYLILS